jgi:hypothetical protein
MQQEKKKKNQLQINFIIIFYWIFIKALLKFLK